MKRALVLLVIACSAMPSRAAEYSFDGGAMMLPRVMKSLLKEFSPARAAIAKHATAHTASG